MKDIRVNITNGVYNKVFTDCWDMIREEYYCRDTIIWKDELFPIMWWEKK